MEWWTDSVKTNTSVNQSSQQRFQIRTRSSHSQKSWVLSSFLLLNNGTPMEILWMTTQRRHNEELTYRLVGEGNGICYFNTTLKVRSWHSSNKTNIHYLILTYHFPNSNKVHSCSSKIDPSFSNTIKNKNPWFSQFLPSTQGVTRFHSRRWLKYTLEQETSIKASLLLDKQCESNLSHIKRHDSLV